MDLPSATPQGLQAPKNREWPQGWTIRYVAETGSTNADLINLGASEVALWPNKSVLVANHQTAGKGRLGRTWEAPPGSNLLASILFREVPTHLHELTQQIGLAIVGAVRSLVELKPLEQVTLKWPNDVLLGGAKLAGVLAQAKLGPANEVEGVVVGFGVNIAWRPEGAASLNGQVHPHVLLHEVLCEFDRLSALSADRFFEQYKSNLSTLGSRVRVDLPTGESVVGTAIDVARDGELKLVDACALTHRISAGDVVHLRPEP